MKNKIEFPNIYRNRVLDERAVRFYAVYMTAVSEQGISIPLAKAIERFVVLNEQDKSYEQTRVDQIIGEDYDN